VSCEHARTTAWRPGAYYPERSHGPEVLRSVAGETVYRSWSTCLDCGIRLERSSLTKRVEGGPT
jgi:hypothetical protein